MAKNISAKATLLIVAISIMSSGVGLVEHAEHLFHGLMLIVTGAILIILREFIKNNEE